MKRGGRESIGKRRERIEWEEKGKERINWEEKDSCSYRVSGYWG